MTTVSARHLPFSALFLMAAAFSFAGTETSMASGTAEEIPGAPPVSVPSLDPESPCRTEASLHSFLDDSGYEVGYYVIQPGQGRVLTRHADREVCLASMVKVFCLTELMRRHVDGLNLEATRIDVPGHGRVSLLRAADLMIGKSDNPATSALCEYLGRETVNAIPEMLGLEGFSSDILPDEETLHATLDVRIVGDRQAAEGLPQHGTARGMASYYTKLLDDAVISSDVSRELREFFGRHPKPFAEHFESAYTFGGKGGNILWTRPPRHYSMMGWGLMLTSAQPAGEPGQQRPPLVLCVWGEWFPPEMTPDEQSDFLKYVTDSLIAILEAPQRAAKRLERQTLDFQL